MPDRLYYYCSLGDDEHKLWFEQMVLDRLIYFRRRGELNDPNELRPTIVFEGTEAEVRQFIKQLIAERRPSLNPAQRVQLTGQLRYLYTRGDLSSVLHESLDRVGVFCLSESQEHPLMWAHYAQGHRGVCIEFDANVPPLSLTEPLLYTDQRPVINRLRDSATQIIQKSVLTKSLLWSYEREWRAIARWRDEERQNRFIEQHQVVDPATREFILSQHGPGHYTLPQGAVLGVTLGANASPETVAWVEGVVHRADPPLPISRASLRWDGVVVIQ